MSVEVVGGGWVWKEGTRLEKGKVCDGQDCTEGCQCLDGQSVTSRRFTVRSCLESINSSVKTSP